MSEKILPINSGKKIKKDERKKIIEYLHSIGIEHEWQLRQIDFGAKMIRDAFKGKHFGEAL